MYTDRSGDLHKRSVHVGFSSPCCLEGWAAQGKEGRNKDYSWCSIISVLFRSAQNLSRLLYWLLSSPQCVFTKLATTHRRTTVFQYFPSYCGVPGNDIVDSQVKDVLNFSFPVKPTTCCTDYKKGYDYGITRSETQTLGNNTGGQITAYST